MESRAESALDDRVRARVAHNLELCAKEFTGYDRLAARHMFSEFHHLERIAVLAAERGDCIEGQLEDEYVHFETFRRLAERYGGVVEPCEEVSALIDYLTSLEGEASIAALNVTAESWLETVFHHVGRWGCCDEMMRIIESDEERHAALAMDLPKPPTEEIEPIMRRLEEHLENIAVAPAFMLPLIYFAGEKRVCRMGASIIRAHERACAHFGIESNTHRVRLLVRSQRMWANHKPTPVEMTEWDRTKMQLYPAGGDMTLWFQADVGRFNGYQLQAVIVGALSRILQRDSRLRYVTRRGQLWCAQEPIVAVRGLHDERAVMNVQIPGAHRTDWRGVLRQMNRRFKKARATKYKAVPRMPDGLAELIPPSRIAIAVNFNGGNGSAAGTGPLSNVEGIPALVTLGQVRDGKIVITLLMDHRTADGQDIDRLQQQLEREIAKEVEADLAERGGRVACRL